MMIASSLVIIAVNLLVLGMIWLIWRFILSRGPTTAARLRRLVVWDRIAPSDIVPCSGDFGAAAALLRALEQGGSAQALVRAHMVRWLQMGAISVGQAGKKKLRSFGDETQAELSFPQECLKIEGAAGLLYQQIYSWLSEDGTLQRSELYQAARQDAEAVNNILRQMLQEGQRSLREMGGAAIESKKAKFGFSDEAREIYTTKGIRLAREIAAYAKFVQENIVPETPMAAVAGGIAPETMVCVLADAIYNGMQAGKQVCR